MSMRFTLDGESFDLTPELGRARLDGQSPEDIREYWVEIDGVCWPVKQVIAMSTGAKRTRIQSQDSHRWLHNLAFPIGTGSAQIAHKPGPTRSPALRRTFDPSTLGAIETLDVRVAFSWLRAGAVTLDREGLPLFPALPRLPGLYRFDFGTNASDVRTLYIGESVELARRASNYRNAKTDRSRQRTSRRIHQEVVAHLSAGGAIEFAIATEVRWAADEPLDLRLKSARRLAENAVVLLAPTRPETAVLNIDADLAGAESDDE
jgi:hypothetical protein